MDPSQEFSSKYERVKVLVETPERSVVGYIHKPVTGEGYRVSDYLNAYGDKFLRLTEAEIVERGQHHRIGDKYEFIAVSVAAITYIAPLEGE